MPINYQEKAQNNEVHSKKKRTHIYIDKKKALFKKKMCMIILSMPINYQEKAQDTEV